MAANYLSGNDNESGALGLPVAIKLLA